MKKPAKNTFKKLWSKKPFRLTVWTLALLVWVWASVTVTQFIVAYPMLWLLGPEKLQLPVWNAVYSAIVYALALCLIIFVPYKILKKEKTNREELGLLGWPTWTDIGLAPIGFVASLLVAQVFTALFSFFPWFDASEAQDVGFNYLATGSDRALAFLALVVIAPIAEEIIFRGWLYGKLRREFSMPLAIFLTSLLFGIVHGQWNVGVTVFAMSIVLCGLREVTGTIYSGILLHMIKNGVAFYLLYIIS